MMQWYLWLKTSTREPLFDGWKLVLWMVMELAMRYTEARLSPIAMEMLKDIEKETVDMVPNYQIVKWNQRFYQRDILIF